MIFNFTAKATLNYEENDKRIWTTGKTYECKSNDMRTIIVMTDEGLWGSVGPDNLIDFEDVFVTDFKVDDKYVIPTKYLSPKAKDDIYRSVWKEHVIEDVMSRAEDIGMTITEEDAAEVANRYVYDGDYDCTLSYWANIDNLINDVKPDANRISALVGGDGHEVYA